MIPSLTIQNFRLFKHLAIEKLARVNLITGKNNSGKSALLECVRLFSTEGSFDTIVRILTSRDKHAKFNILSIQSIYNYELLDNENPEIEIKNSDNHLKIEIAWVKQAFDGYKKIENDSLDTTQQTRGLIKTYNSQVYKPLALYLKGDHGYSTEYDLRENSQKTLCFYITSSSGPDKSYEDWWGQLVRKSKEKQVIDCLKIILPEVENITMLPKGDGLNDFLIKLKSLEHPRSITSFGEGVRRLLYIIIAMVSAQNDYLCIDEFENGIHYSVLPELWKTILLLSEKLNVQVFATTHSWDCINAFQVALNESDAPETGQLIRLKERNGKITSTILNAEDLAVTTRENIEVR